MRCLLTSALALFSTAAAARDCSTLVNESLAYARAPAALLQDYDALRRYTRFVDEHAEGVFIDTDERWLATASFALRTLNVLGSTDCDGDRDAALSLGNAHSGLLGSIEYRPRAFKLSVFALGHMESRRLDESGAEETVYLSHTRGLIGATAQLSEWLSVSIAQLSTSVGRGDDLYWREALAMPPSQETEYLFEVGVPRAGLSGRMTRRDGELDLHELSWRDVPLSEQTRGAVTVRAMPTEDRWVFVPKLNYAHLRAEQRGIDFGVSFNSPKMLDLLPHTANRGMLSVGVNLANHW